MEAVDTVLDLLGIEWLMGISLQDICDLVTCLCGNLLSKCPGIKGNTASSRHRYQHAILIVRDGFDQSRHNPCSLANTFLVAILDTVCQGTDRQIVGRGPDLHTARPVHTDK